MTKNERKKVEKTQKIMQLDGKILQVKDIYKQGIKLLKRKKTMRKTETEKRLRIIEEAVKDGSYQKWIDFGSNLLKRYYWSETYDYLNYDVVHTLIEKILTGVHVKNWDFEKLNINQIMYKNIFGAVNKLNMEQSLRIITMDNFVREEVDKVIGLELDDLRYLKLEEVEKEIDKREYFKLFEKHIAKDKECLKLFYGFVNNEFRIHDNKEISRKLNLKKRTVENAKKRFERSVQSFQKKGYNRMFNSEGKEIFY